MKVLCWNVRRAAEHSPVWAILTEFDPDIALLQEVTSVPHEVAATYTVLAAHPTGQKAQPQRFHTVILTKGQLSPGVPLACSEPWADEELRRLEGNFLSAKVVSNNLRLNVVSAYSPAWRISEERLAGVDLSKVRLPGNPYLWATEVFWLSLIHTMKQSDDPWIIGGDFNSSETFDLTWGRGNAEVLKRMSALGLIECLRKVHGRLVPTFKNPRGQQVIHQLDHLWVSNPFPWTLEECVTGDVEVVFGSNLSDHLPVLATFGPPVDVVPSTQRALE